MIEVVGWTGSVLFSLCALPQAAQCAKQGHARGVSKLFMWMWVLGEILMQFYVILQHGFDMPLLVNYWINTAFCLIIMKYMYWERK